MLQPDAILQGRYRIDRLIGKGGMGLVYLARQIRLADRPVAIKALTVEGSTPEERQRVARQFEREARFLATLSHPGLVDVKDFFEEDGRLYLVMDYVEGRNLAQVVREPADIDGVDRVLDWGRQLLDVLDYLHAHQPPIVLRDLKPGNIMLDPGGKLRVIDFGIAREHQPELDSSTGLRGAGTPGYAPPEQYGGKADQRSDLYALGATLYALLTTKVPPNAVLRTTEEERLLPLDQVNPNVCPELAAVIHDLLAVRKEDRPQSVQQVRDMLERAAVAQEHVRRDATTRVAAGLHSSAEVADSGLITLTGATCADCGTPLPSIAAICQKCGSLGTGRDTVVGGLSKARYWNSVLPPDRGVAEQQAHLTPGGDRVERRRNGKSPAPPRRRLGPTVAGVVVVVSLLLGGNQVRKLYDARQPRPAPMTGRRLSNVVAPAPMNFHDPLGLFQITVPINWHYGTQDPTPGGSVPAFTRLVMGSPGSTDFAVVEYYDNCATADQAMALVRSYLQEEGQSPRFTRVADDTYDLQAQDAGQTVHGRCYCIARAGHVWRLAFLSVGTSTSAEFEPIRASFTPRPPAPPQEGP